MRKLLAIPLAVVLVLATVLTAVPVMADDSVSVDTHAVITGCGSPPEVHAVWTSPHSPVIPNLMEPTKICVFALVSDPNGLGDIKAVYADVYHPDGSLKVQIHLERCCPKGECVDVDGIKAALDGDEELTAEEKARCWDMFECHQVELWCGCFEYHPCEQPAGKYMIKTWAVDGCGESAEKPHVRCLCIKSLVALAIDFKVVDFGEIKASVDKWVPGNDTFDDGIPTVFNLGNDPARLWVKSTAMVGPMDKKIEDFDVWFKGQEIRYVAGEKVYLENCLGPCEMDEICFSVHAPDGSPAGEYGGKLYLGVEHCCRD